MNLTHLAVLSIIAAATAPVAAEAENENWRFTAFLAFGVVVGVFWSCLSKERIEAGRVTKARILAGMIGGIGLPYLVEFVSPWKLELNKMHPILTLVAGFVCAVLGFFALHAVLRKVEPNQEVIGGALKETVKKAAERKLGIVRPGQTEREKENEQPTSQDSGN